MTTKFDRVKPPSEDDLTRRLADLEREVRALRASRRLESASIGRGGLTVRNEGGVTVKDGGNVTVEEDGRLETLYTNGETAVSIGGFSEEADGALVQLFKEDGSTVVFQLFRQVDSPEVPGGRSSATLQLDNFVLVSDSGQIVGGNGLTDWLLTGGLQADDVTITPRGTTGSAANVRFNASGRLLEVTSSRRWKQEIEDAPDRSDEILTVRGRTWRDKGARADDKGARHVGYIAEELDEAGLTEFVEYDDEGLPRAIAYDRLTVPLVQLAQRQEARIEELERRLSALEN